MYLLPLKQSMYLSSRKGLSRQATMCSRASCSGVSCLVVFSMTAVKFSKVYILGLVDMRFAEHTSFFKYVADNR